MKIRVHVIKTVFLSLQPFTHLSLFAFLHVTNLDLFSFVIIFLWVSLRPGINQKVLD